MAEDLALNQEMKSMKIREKIHLGIKTRLQLVIPF